MTQADPLTGASWTIATLEPNAGVLALWGAPHAHDIRAMLAAAEPWLARERIARLVLEIGAIERVDVAAMGELATFVMQRLHALAEKVEVVAIRVGGACATAFPKSAFVTTAFPFPVVHTETLADALRAARIPVDLVPAFEATLETVRRDGSLLTQVRAELGRGTEASAIARSVGLSLRTLQRRLRDAGTSLEAERTIERIARAREALRTTERSITEIAFDLGFASSQEFARAFRRATNMSPSAYRAQTRTGA